MSSKKILDDIKAEYFRKSLEIRHEFNRSLPFQDAIFDRWERAKTLGFDEDVSIYNSAFVFGNVSVGRDTWIGPYVILDGSGGELFIGANCSISAAVHIYTHDTVLWAVSGGVKQAKRASVKLGNNVYVGSQAVIAAGVRIGDNCVIASNSFVNCDIPNRSVVGGSPARVIGHVVGAGDNVELKYLDKENR